MANLSPRNGGASLAARLGLSPEALELIRNTVAKDTNDLELELFLSTCKTRGFDPLDGLLYCVIRNKDNPAKRSMTLQVSIDGLRALAQDSGEYDGQDPPAYTYDAKGSRLISATVTVYRKNMGRGISATALFDEYKQTDYNGNLTKFWKDMPHNQLAKCAESLALRKGFPRVLKGVYSDDEAGQADNVRNVTPLRASSATAAPDPKPVGPALNPPPETLPHAPGPSHTSPPPSDAPAPKEAATIEYEEASAADIAAQEARANANRPPAEPTHPRTGEPLERASDKQKALILRLLGSEAAVADYLGAVGLDGISKPEASSIINDLTSRDG